MIASALYIHAQTVDTAILGTVSDSGGAVVPKVPITITQSATGVSHTTVSSDGGAYEVRYLVPGDYAVEVRANGFRSERRTGILIEIGQQARIDFTLQVGDVQQTVEVNTTVAVLDGDSAGAGVKDAAPQTEDAVARTEPATEQIAEAKPETKPATAEAAPAKYIESTNPRTKQRAANLMKPPFRDNGWLGCENS